MKGKAKDEKGGEKGKKRGKKRRTHRRYVTPVNLNSIPVVAINSAAHLFLKRRDPGCN